MPTSSHGFSSPKIEKGTPDGPYPLSARAQSVRVRMPAKINLHLGTYPGHDERGYHRVDSIMVAVGLFDELNAREGCELSVGYSPAIDVAERQSAAWRAIASFAGVTGKDARLQVSITRDIPSQAGLGSASADAAAALIACCALHDMDPRGVEVREIAHDIGADVGFFLDPQPTYLTGIGDVPTKTFPTLRMPIALVMPTGHGLSTRDVYDEFDRLPTHPASPDAMCSALASGNPEAIAQCLHNNLAEASLRLSPSLGSALEWVRAHVMVRAAQVTGSGSCIFALCDDEDGARIVAHDARQRGWWSHATHTVGASAMSAIML